MKRLAGFLALALAACTPPKDALAPRPAQQPERVETPSKEELDPNGLEICDGKDNDGDGLVDEDQTGWVGFCDKAHLLDPKGYAFRHPKEFWRAKFDALREDPAFEDNRARTRTRADGSSPCDQEPYNLHRVFKALLTMFEATGDRAYLDEACDLADRMIRSSTSYDPAWAYPFFPAQFEAWAEGRELRYWSAERCAPDVPLEGARTRGFRYMLNELQGIRGMTALALVLKRAKDPRFQYFFDYATQVVSFFAMEGGGNPSRRLDEAGDKRAHYVVAALDLFRASGDPTFKRWAHLVDESLRKGHLGEDGDYLFVRDPPTKEAIDTNHANRYVEVVLALADLGEPGARRLVRKSVNTLLFKIWENRPGIQIQDLSYGAPLQQYPHLFRNFVDGDNHCWGGGNPPYRTGGILMGWHELARYDRRVLYLLESLTEGLVARQVTGTFPGADGCVGNGNSNYPFILDALAEMTRLAPEPARSKPSGPRG